ncbi:MAG: hypothetical protein AB7Q00_14650 [Phycisphaerales bacterium]
MSKCPIGHYCPHGDRFCPVDVPHTVAKRRISDAAKKRSKKLKVASGRHITIAAIARELNRTPRECRAALRNLDIKKPTHGWSWPPSEATAIKSRLSKKFGGKSGRQSPRSRPPVQPSVAYASTSDDNDTAQIVNEIGVSASEALAHDD